MSAASSIGSGPSAAELFRHRDYLLFQAARFVAVVCLLMMSVAVGWQVYRLTGKALNLGMVGLAQFLPLLLLSLVSGQVVDRVDRRAILVICYAALGILGLGLALLSRHESPDLRLIYALLVLVGVVRAFEGPAETSMLPFLIPQALMPRGVALSSSVFMGAVIAGPALGGVLLNLPGKESLVYFVGSLGVFLGAVAMSLIKKTASGESREKVNWESLVAGLRFVFTNKLILGAISLDLVAVLLGGTVALLPVFARDILHTGPQGLGLLRAAPAAGAALVAATLMFRPLKRRAGAALFAAVLLFGLATTGFGLSRSFPVSALLLAVLGAADMISVVVRHTLVQTRTPAALLGRVSTVNMVFIGASNELGEFESGLTAHWFGAVNAVLIGGAGTIIVTLLWWRWFRELAEVDTLDPPPPTENSQEAASPS